MPGRGVTSAVGIGVIFDTLFFCLCRETICWPSCNLVRLAGGQCCESSTSVELEEILLIPEAHWAI